MVAAAAAEEYLAGYGAADVEDFDADGFMDWVVEIVPQANGRERHGE